MNRKKIITLCLSIILLALIGVGGTLAYLTSNTEQLNNRFTFSNGISMQLDEDRIDKNLHTVTEENGVIAGSDKGNDYLNVLPGEVLHKDPTVTILANSPDCYVFVSVKNPSEELLSLNISDEWMFIDKIDDISYYVYVKDGQPESVKASKQNTRLTLVFDSVTVANIINKDNSELVSLSDIEVKASAVQSKVAGEDNYDEVKAEGLGLLGYHVE